MSYEISQVEREAVTAPAISRRVPTSTVADALGDALPRVFEFGTRHGLTFTGPPCAKYSDWTAGGVTLTCGLPVAEPGEGSGEIRPMTIPAGSYARTMHRGSYDTLNKAHEALEKWIIDHELEAGDASYEFYDTDPGQYPNEEDWRTEVLREIS